MKYDLDDINKNTEEQVIKYRKLSKSGLQTCCDQLHRYGYSVISVTIEN